MWVVALPDDSVAMNNALIHQLQQSGVSEVVLNRSDPANAILLPVYGDDTRAGEFLPEAERRTRHGLCVVTLIAQNIGVNSVSIDLPDFHPGALNLNHNPRNGFPFFNTSLFTPNALGTPGTSSRRFFYGPGINNFDIALHKTTKITESKSLEFRFKHSIHSIMRSSIRTALSTATSTAQLLDSVEGGATAHLASRSQVPVLDKTDMSKCCPESRGWQLVIEHIAVC
jgi:hypothetical protein